MKEKNTNRIVIASIVLTVLSFMFLVGVLIYNIRRLTFIDNINAASMVVASLFVVGSLGLILYIVVLSFVPFLKKEEPNRTKYVNVLIVALVFRLFLYVIYEAINFTWNGGIGGFLNDFHYASYIFVEKMDVLPISVFPIASLSFIHTLLTTDLLGVGLVILGYVLIKKEKYAPLMAIMISILINIIAIFVINIMVIRQYGVELIYYKLDSVFATLITEFAMLGFIVYDMFRGTKK